MHEREVQAEVARAESAIEALEALPDSARDRSIDAVQALLALYGEGLRRVMTQIVPDSPRIIEQLVADELVSHLLLVHGLHPVDVETRVRRGLEQVRPYLDSHGGSIELIEVVDGTARVRFHGTCHGCPASALTLRLAIDDAVQKAAPEIERVEAENIESLSSPPSVVRNEVAERGSWLMVGALPQLAADGVLMRGVAGEDILFVRAGGTLYAYRPDCPRCHESLRDARVVDAMVVCASCGSRYDARRAGRCCDVPEMYLEPIPLLEAASGLIKIALAEAPV